MTIQTERAMPSLVLRVGVFFAWLVVVPVSCANREASPAPGSGSITADLGAASSGSVSPAAMSDALTGRLRDEGITVQTLAVELAPADANVSGSVAASTARDGPSSVVASDAAATVSLVQFTDIEHGRGSADGTIDPMFVSRKAWAVVFSGVKLQHPAVGPQVVGGYGGGMGVTKTGTLVVFIDADSGGYLEALGLSASDTYRHR